MKSMRIKSVLIFILLIGGIELYAQDANRLYPKYDFSLRNAVNECFTNLRSGAPITEELFLSAQAVSEDSDFPEIVRLLWQMSKEELSSLEPSLSSLKPYVEYEYRYISWKDVTYVIGVAVAEYHDTEMTDMLYPMISRPLFFIYTDKGWKAFWIGPNWMPARFAGNDVLAILGNDDLEMTITDLVSMFRDVFADRLMNSSDPKNGTTADSGEALEKTESTEAISYELATVKPTFYGRPASDFSDWVQQNVSYPESARKQGLTGTAIVKFMIDTDGKVTDVQVVESSGRRTKEQFEEQMNLASFIAKQYKGQLNDLVNRNASIQSIMNTQKLYEQAQQRVRQLKKLYSNKNYVLPEYDVLDKEAKRVVASSPDWKPGEYNGSPIPVEFTVSVVLAP